MKSTHTIQMTFIHFHFKWTFALLKWQDLNLYK